MKPTIAVQRLDQLGNASMPTWRRDESAPSEFSARQAPGSLARLLVGLSLLCGLPFAGSPAAAADAPEVSPRLMVYGPAPGLSLTGPMGIAIDSKRGEVLVANTGSHRIEIYSYQGRLRKHFIHRVRTRDGSSIAGQPAELLIDSSGNTLVVDKLASYVDVLTFRGRALTRLELSTPGQAFPVANSVAGVTVAPSGDIFVASGDDTARVYRFDASYRLRACWAPAEKDNRLNGVRGISALPDGRLVITSSTSKLVVRIYESTGEFVNGFGGHEVGPGNFSNPSGVVTTADGRIWVSDEIRQSVQVFDSTGNFLGALSGAGEFNYPSALATDGKEYLAVTERLGNRFQLLKIR